jgi:hypothetical protein
MLSGSAMLSRSSLAPTATFFATAIIVSFLTLRALITRERQLAI